MKMTESEAKGFVQGKLDCMEKCDVFNREDKHRNNDCDNCEYCYSQGNFGQQKEAFEVAIKALEKQISKKPLNITKVKVGKCPCCNDIVDESNIVCDCGQKLDWSDEE